MDDATVDADLFGDPSSNAFSDHLLGNEEALAEEAAAAAERRRVSESRSGLTEPEWRTSRRIVQTDISTPVDLRALDYLEVVDENLHCPICHSPLINPVKLKCDHVFCDECLRNALDHQQDRHSSCPSCRGRTDISCISPVTKLVTRILDDLKVRCPLRNRGCLESLPRGGVQDHVDLYCGFGETDCSSNSCDLKVQRRFAEGHCLHTLIPCPNCSIEVMERDLETHQRNSCEVSYSKCPDCTQWIQLNKLDDHSSNCPEAIIACTAAPYGCDFTSRRATLASHLSTCPLAKLTPFIELQKTRLEEHEAALNHLKRKTALYEEGLAAVQDTLHDSLEDPLANPSSTAGPSSSNPSAREPFDAAAAQVLDLHESLTAEIMHIKKAVADLDAKVEMTALNQMLRANDEKNYRDAVESQLKRQMHYLLSSRLQSQRGAMVRAQSEAGFKEGGSAGVSAGATVGKAGPSVMPGRRLSDSMRQDPKL